MNKLNYTYKMTVIDIENNHEISSMMSGAELHNSVIDMWEYERERLENILKENEK